MIAIDILKEVKDHVNNLDDDSNDNNTFCHCCDKQITHKDLGCLQDVCLARETYPQLTHCCNKYCHPAYWGG